MKKVCIDVGHGGSDNGAVANGLKEKDLNLQVALKVREYLKVYDVEIKMTREIDKTLTPDDRVKIVLDFNPDLCVSVHHNSFNTIARGAEVIHSAKEVNDDKIANAILDKLLKAGMPKRRAFTKLNDNGQDYYYMIRRINDNDTDAIITEGGFVDNIDDAKLLKTEVYINAEAKAISDSIVEYLGLKPKTVEQPKDELREALEFIDKNICDVDTDLWINNCKSGKVQYLDALMIKIGNGLKSKLNK